MDQLERICKLFKEDPLTYLDPRISQNNNNNKTAACCDQAWGVTEDNAICGQILPPIPVPVHACVEAESFWTFDYVYGINIDIIILSIDIVLFWVILTLIESNLLNIGWTKLKERYYGSSVRSADQVDDDVQKEKDSIYANNDNLMRVRRLPCYISIPT